MVKFKYQIQMKLGFKAYHLKMLLSCDLNKKFCTPLIQKLNVTTNIDLEIVINYIDSVYN